MDKVSTPEPHFLPGYTGHCPQYTFRVGKTYSNLSHRLLIDPCIRHSPKIVLANGSEVAIDKPTLQEIDLIKAHERDGEAVLKHPILPGYDGFIPNLHSKIGDRFLAAATAGIAEHEQHMQQLRCERRNLMHKVYHQNEEEQKKKDKELPCVTDTDTAEDVTKIPYSKHTPPHFMPDGHPQKYIMRGYDGHVPMAYRVGESNQEQTANALNTFSTDFKNRLGSWVENETPYVSPPTASFEIYHKTDGMIPNYAGHVPGEVFQFGSTYGKHTVNAKQWLQKSKEKGNQ